MSYQPIEKETKSEQKNESPFINNATSIQISELGFPSDCNE